MKKLSVVCLVLLLCLFSSVQAVDYHWWNDADPGDSFWSTGGNWDSGLVPSQDPLVDPYRQSDVFINAGGVCYVNNAVGDAAHCQWLSVGYETDPLAVGVRGTLNVVAGGQLGTGPWGPGEAFIGTRGSDTDYGVVNIDGTGSVAYVEGWRIGNRADGGTGVVNITNGGKMIGGHWGTRIGGVLGTGIVNIIDGTMHIWGSPASDGLTMGAGGLIDVQGSSMLTLDTDQTTLINQLIASGNIVGDGTVGNVAATFNADTGFTEVVVPEPATLVLLGIGGLLLGRRKKA